MHTAFTLFILATTAFSAPVELTVPPSVAPPVAPSEMLDVVGNSRVNVLTEGIPTVDKVTANPMKFSDDDLVLLRGSRRKARAAGRLG
jgi:hypothetical protein